MADRLKFGYFTLSDNSVGYGERRRDPGELIKDVVNQAIAAEGLGYNSAWLPEHHFGYFGVLPTPAQALTFIAARTTACVWRQQRCCCHARSRCERLKNSPC